MSAAAFAPAPAGAADPSPASGWHATVPADQALAQADESDRELAAGRYRGELHGIPYGIKDCFDTAGIPTTWGAIPFRDQVPDRDARIVTMLREAGAVLLGKLATASAISAMVAGCTSADLSMPGDAAARMGVSAGPGEIIRTRINSGRSSAASEPVSPFKPTLEAV